MKHIFIHSVLRPDNLLHYKTVDWSLDSLLYMLQFTPTWKSNGLEQDF